MFTRCTGFSDSAQVDERRADDDRLPERINPSSGPFIGDHPWQHHASH